MTQRDVLFRVNNGTALDTLDLQMFETLKNTVYQNEEVAVELDGLVSKFGSTIAVNSADAGLSELLYFKDDVEQRLIERLHNWSVPFALALFRSILALNAAEKFGPRHELARIVRIMDLAICRYCRYDVDDVVSDGDGIWGIRIAECDVRAMLGASRLAQLLGTCQVDLRRLAYGGTLMGTGNAWSVELPTDVQSLSDLHDSRILQYGNLFRHAGIPGEDSLPLGRGKCWILLGGKNESQWLWCGRRKEHFVGRSEESQPMVSANDSYVPAYMLVEFSLDSYIKTLEAFENAMVANGFGLDVALTLLSTLATAGRQQYETLRPGHRLRSFGFTIMSREDVVERVMQVLEAAHRPTTAEIVNCAIRFIGRRSDDAARISFNDPAGLRNLVDLKGDHLLVDYMTSFSAVRRLFDMVGEARGIDANARGASFEHYVATRLVDAIPTAAKLWVSRRLTFANGEIREADVGVTIGDLLLLCECKARPQRMRDDGITSSHNSGLAVRQLGDLNQVDSLAGSLSSKLLRGPAPLPSHVTRIIPCVVTTSVEWVGSTDPRMWLVPGRTPRVCTVEELVDALTGAASGFGTSLENEILIKTV